MIRMRTPSTGACVAAVAAIGLLAMPAAASSITDYVGEWSCEWETKFTFPNELQFVSVYILDIKRNGKVSGNEIQGHPGDVFFPPFELRCEFEGTAEPGPEAGFLTYSESGTCEGFEPTGEVSTVECLGALRSSGAGFRKMYCIETTQEGASAVAAAGECERTSVR